MATYSVYIVQCADGTYYTGIARDVAARVEVHNTSLQGSKYTRARRPVQLRYVETCPNRSVAQKREYVIRTLTRAHKTALIETYEKS